MYHSRWHTAISFRALKTIGFAIFCNSAIGVPGVHELQKTCGSQKHPVCMNIQRPAVERGKYFKSSLPNKVRYSFFIDRIIPRGRENAKNCSYKRKKTVNHAYFLCQKGIITKPNRRFTANKKWQRIKSCSMSNYLPIIFVSTFCYNNT